MDADGLSHRILLADTELLQEEDSHDLDLSVGYDVHRELVTTRFKGLDAPTSEMGAGETEADDRGEATTSPETTPLTPNKSESKSGAKLAAVLADKLRLPFYSSSRVSCFSILLLCILLSVYVLNQADRLVLPVVIPAGLRCSGANKSDACAQLSVNHSIVPGDLLEEADNGTTHGSPSCIAFNDWEQGLLTGPAFTVIYVLAGLPLAYLADWKSRPLVLILGLSFWSLVVLLTSFTEAFWELLLLRIFLGIGEASCNPVAYSLLADFFPPNHRAVALSVYHFGVYLGGAIGYLCGALNSALDWRWTFRILGIAGLTMVPVAVVMAWEPKHVRERRKRRKAKKKRITVGAVARHLLWPSFTSGTFWMLVVAGAVRNIAGYALGAWLPTFFVVQYCVSSADYGLKAGLVVLFGGTTGAFLGGFVADRLSRRFRNSKAFVISISQILAVPAIIGVLIAPTAQVSYGLLFVAYITAETWLGPAAAIVQDITVPSMRSVSSAVFIGVITIVASLGPVLVPSFNSDGNSGSGVQMGLLVVVTTCYLTSSVLFAVLGVVIWAGHRRGKLLNSYAPFENEPEGQTKVDH